MLTILELIISVVLIVLILIQERSSGLSGIFGGGGGGAQHTRRGAERFLFWGTIICAVLFAALAILKLTL